MCMKRIRKKIRNTIAVLLAVALPCATLSVPMPRVRAEENLYISEVKLGYGETAEEAATGLQMEGYRILTSDEENTSVEPAYQSYADLNKGGSSGNALARKGTAIVYLGYKTTNKPEEAITDLATMNMKGGYSFADYQKLMEQHRDQVVRPFLEKFMGTIREYRTNYNSSNEDNRAKAKLIHDVLNKIIDDDTGMGMGDLLLAETKDELGESAWSKLSDEEKKKHGDLTTILVQAQGGLVTMMEQLLTFAADTADNSWMERFLAYSKEGLEKQYLDQGMTGTDVAKKLAEQYDDTAKALADKWSYLRGSLLEYRESDAGREYDKALEEAKKTGGSEEYGDAGESTAPGREERKAMYEEPVDAKEDPEFEAKLESIPEVKDATTALKATTTMMELQNEIMEGNEETNLEMLYIYLSCISYGDGTLLDFFMQPVEEVSGKHIEKLYPIAAALSEGQKAGLDLLSMEQLVRIGIADNVAYSVALTKLEEAVKKTGTVSVYEGVNRELFSDGVALTSEALRKNPDHAGLYNEDTLGVSLGYNGLFLLGGIASGVAFKMTLNSISRYNDMIPTWMSDIAVPYDKLRQSYAEGQAFINNFQFETDSAISAMKVSYNFKPATSYSDAFTIVTLEDAGHNTVQMYGDPKVMNEQLGTTGDKVLENLKKKEADILEQETKALQIGKPWGRYILTGVFLVVMIGAAAYSLYNSYQEMRAYYHQEMTKIPKYIVDEVDITKTDENGKKIFVRNDTAYYQAVRCNRKNDSADYAMMKDFGDLNGDVGKQWMALYTQKNGSVPILADSLKVVMGNPDLPEGYKTGIHMIGEKAAVNLTDERYTYNNGMNGIYVYYKTADESASGTASAFGGGVLALVGAGGVLVGVILGAVITILIKKKKEGILEDV